MKNQRTEPQSFYDLIDRLQAVSTINHPQRPWSEDFYYSCAMAWIGKEEELKQRVEMLEARLAKEIEAKITV